MKFLFSLIILFTLTTFAESQEEDTSFKGTIGPFYDGNVAQSIGHEGGTGAPGGGPGGLGGHGGGGGPLSLPNGRPTSTVYIDWGAIANLEYDPTIYKMGKNEMGLMADIETSSYQTYTSYNYESVKLGPTWQNENDSRELSASLYYQSTFYTGIYSQDYLKLDTSYLWKANTPELGIGLDFYQYMRTHTSAFSVSLPLTAAFHVDTLKITLGVSPAFGGGSPAQYYQSGMGAVPTVVGGDEFSRYWETVYSLALEQKWTDRLKMSLTFSETINNYAQESVPFTVAPGVFYNARTDILAAAALDLKYQIRPDKWSCELSGSFTRSWANGYQGLPSGGSGPPTYSFDRPYGSLTLIYEI